MLLELFKFPVNIQVLGLLLDILGAYFVVRSFIIKKPADIKSEAYGNANSNLRIAYGMSDFLFFSFYKQGIEARIGLVLIIPGFFLQAFGVLHPISLPLSIIILILFIAVISSIFIHRYFTNDNRIAVIRDRDERKFDKRLKNNKFMKREKQKSGFIIIIANIILASVAVATFLLIFYQNGKLDRPYIGLVDTNVYISFTSIGVNPDSTKINPGEKIVISIKNYGNLPAYFQATYEDEYNIPMSYQWSESYIMPGQSIDIKWNVLFSDQPIYDDNVCKFLENRTITIRYGLDINDMNFITKVRSKLINAPRDIRKLEDEDGFREMVVRCGGLDKRENMLPVWHIETMK